MKLLELRNSGSRNNNPPTCLQRSKSSSVAKNSAISTDLVYRIPPESIDTSHVPAVRSFCRNPRRHRGAMNKARSKDCLRVGSPPLSSGCSKHLAASTIGLPVTKLSFSCSEAGASRPLADLETPRTGRLASAREHDRTTTGIEELRFGKTPTSGRPLTSTRPVVPWLPTVSERLTCRMV